MNSAGSERPSAVNKPDFLVSAKLEPSPVTHIKYTKCLDTSSDQLDGSESAPMKPSLHQSLESTARPTEVASMRKTKSNANNGDILPSPKSKMTSPMARSLTQTTENARKVTTSSTKLPTEPIKVILPPSSRNTVMSINETNIISEAINKNIPLRQQVTHNIETTHPDSKDTLVVSRSTDSVPD
ncbi:hypothetical protein DPMN_070496 [Dreissena polymorpha]|uniref:Uncharacterized protein n=1 Tax=Dreissena polymorpha TaxID=45954 RepID=A0A9D3Z620_DREPO|nr:hypothetical protein DPMN_070496 [Dreissena polymorpha]